MATVKQPLGVVCLAALAVLAGCGGLAGDAPERSPSLTPAPVPTTAQPFPPGVSDGGVSVSTLTAAHRNRLLSTNYTVVVRQRVVDANGTIMRSTRRHRVAVGGEPYYGRHNLTLYRFGTRRPVDRLTYWSGPEGFATRFSGGPGAPVLYWSTDGNRSIDIDGSGELGRVVAALSPTVADRRPDAVVLVATSADDARRLPGPSYVGDRHNVSATFVVSLDGLVTDWRIAYDARFDGRPVRVVHTVRIADVGTTTVPRPDWVEAARR
ncbi:MAG: hypothetical protein V5A44_02950 [Haloarculaceae archaeon]